VSRPAGGGGGAAGWLAGALLVLLAVAGVIAIGRGRDDTLSPRSDARLGTSALVALTRALGADVSVRNRLPDLDGAGSPDVMLVLVDRFDDAQRRQVTAWVRSGGVLVVTDPASRFAPTVEDSFFDVLDLGFSGARRCAISALADLELQDIDPRGGGILYELPDRSEGCVRDRFGGAFIVATDRGEGTVVAVGGSGMAVNVALARGENAPVMAALLAPRPGTDLAVLEPGGVGGAARAVPGGRTLADLVSPGVKRALVQLGIAFVVYALWRARRLGRPVAEPQPVSVAASELVAAVGNLLDRSGSPEHAAELLRNDLRRFLADRAGLPAAAGDDVLAAVVAERTGLPAAELRHALGPEPVTDDAGLMALARTSDRIREEVLAHV
jgi:Domain of unknown function (DUF4350)